jgi:hypothetical protein
MNAGLVGAADPDLDAMDLVRIDAVHEDVKHCVALYGRLHGDFRRPVVEYLDPLDRQRTESVVQSADAFHAHVERRRARLVGEMLADEAACGSRITRVDHVDELCEQRRYGSGRRSPTWSLHPRLVALIRLRQAEEITEVATDSL